MQRKGTNLKKQNPDYQRKKSAFKFSEQNFLRQWQTRTNWTTDNQMYGIPTKKQLKATQVIMIDLTLSASGSAKKQMPKLKYKESLIPTTKGCQNTNEVMEDQSRKNKIYQRQ